jgi:hypothetical protein
MVVIGVDAHKRTHTLAVVDEVVKGTQTSDHRLDQGVLTIRPPALGGGSVRALRFRVSLAATSSPGDRWFLQRTDEHRSRGSCPQPPTDGPQAPGRSPSPTRDRLEPYAGVAGVDDEGRREFEETQGAPDPRFGADGVVPESRPGRYRSELLDVLAPQFERAGLPKDHGIELHVSHNGKSWWAWRRTVTGRCFAIGAAEPLPTSGSSTGPSHRRAFRGGTRRGEGDGGNRRHELVTVSCFADEVIGKPDPAPGANAAARKVCVHRASHFLPTFYSTQPT